MVDRLMAIANLGALAAAADSRGDAIAAEQLRDALAALVEAHAEASVLETRRTRDRQRKHKPSTESAEFHGIRGGRGIPDASPPMVSPYKPLPFPPLSVAESAARESARMALGEEFSDVEQFVESREGRTRGAWWREIAKLLTSGATAEDMAGACRDGQAVDPPLGGPYALRAFIGKRKLERNRPPPGVGGGGAPRRTGGVGARTYANALEALEDV